MEWNPETECWEIQTERRATDVPTKGYEVACVATEECARLFMEARGLQAENERLRAALKRLESCTKDMGLLGVRPLYLGEVREIAFDALHGEGH